METPQRTSNTKVIIIFVGGIIFAFVVLCFIAPVLFIILDADDADSRAALPLSPSPTPDLLTFDEVLPEQGKMTNLQWQEYRESLKGKRIENWQGTITDVKQATLTDEYYAEIDMGRNFDDVFLYVDRDVALALPKGKLATFSGVIRRTDLRLIRDGFALEIDGAILEVIDK